MSPLAGRCCIPSPTRPGRPWPAFSAAWWGWNARSDLTESLAEAREARSGWLTEIAANEVPAILEDDTLRQYAMRGGEVLFKENCAPCHQTGGAGAHGYPSLADDEWIWGGTPESILTTVRHGIRDQGQRKHPYQLHA